MRSSKSGSRFARAARVACFEPLERRQMLAATLVQAPQAVNAASGTQQVLDLTSFIDDPALNTQVRFATELGDIDIELFDTTKPISVANFLNYVRQGDYNGTVIHRVTTTNTDGIAVIQGGGFLPFIPSQAQQEPDHIPVDAAIQNEASLDPILSNVRGTIAMARTSDPNSATSEWFINTTDNTALDPAAQPPGFAVFGQVVNNTIGVADAIQALPTFQLSQTFASTPLQNVQPGQTELLVDNYVELTARTLPTKLTFTAETSNPAVATVAVEGNLLTLSLGPTVGVSTITINGTDGQNNTITQTFIAVAGPPVAAGLPVTLGGTSGVTSVAFTDADGTAGTVSLKGAGTAVVTFAGDSLTQATAGKKVNVSGAPTGITSVAITGGNTTTAVTISGKGGNSTVDLNGLTATTTLKSISAKTTNFTGTLNVNGPLGKLDLGNTNNATINIEGLASDKPVAISLGDAVATGIRSLPPIKTLKAVSFTDADTTDREILTSSLGKFTTTGDLANGVDVTGAIKSVSVGGNLTGDVIGDSIGSLIVKGNMTDLTVRARRPFAEKEKPLGKVTVNGAISGSVISANGNITSVTAASIAGSSIAGGAGVSLPTQASEFLSPATIGTVTIKGAYAGTDIVASSLGKMKLGALTTDNGGTPFGLGAQTITSVTGSVGGAPAITIKKLDTQADVDAQIAGADLGNFLITLL